VRRIPLLSGSRVVLVPVADEEVLVLPPPPSVAEVDTAPAVRDALRFPLAGASLESVVRRGGRVTIVVQPPSLPLPGAQTDPRREALAEVVDELAACGVPDERQTILVAGGLGQRLGRRDLEQLLPPPKARAFRGRVLVHDASDEALAPIAEWERRTISVSPELLETDAVVVVSAAETILHGGPGALLAACDASTVRGVAAASSLVQASGAPEWSLAVLVQSELARRVPLVAVSLALDHPRLTGIYRGYPHEFSSLQHVRSSPFRRAFSLLPGGLRRAVLDVQKRRLATTAVYAGPPSVAHAEALLRGVERRGARLPHQVDALVAGVPWSSPHLPREPLNPVTTAALTLGHALRLWRDAFPVADGGTLILAHAFRRRFAHGPRDPYRALFDALTEPGPDALARAEARAANDPRGLAEYRAGRSCHPLLPFADWAGCAPALSRLGRVIVAGSRDAVAARSFDFVPTHSISSALEMAHGIAGGRARVGVLVTPPYAPLLVGPLGAQPH
jgi:hypothetical protein